MSYLLNLREVPGKAQSAGGVHGPHVLPTRADESLAHDTAAMMACGGGGWQWRVAVVAQGGVGGDGASQQTATMRSAMVDLDEIYHDLNHSLKSRFSSWPPLRHAGAGGGRGDSGVGLDVHAGAGGVDESFLQKEGIDQVLTHQASQTPEDSKDSQRRASLLKVGTFKEI